MTIRDDVLRVIDSALADPEARAAELIDQYEAEHGAGSTAELFKEASAAQVDRLRRDKNAKLFAKKITRLETTGLNAQEQVELLSAALVSKPKTKRPGPPASVGIVVPRPRAQEPTTASAPPPAAGYPALEKYERMRSENPRLAGEFFAEQGSAIVKEEASRTRALRAEFRKQQAEKINKH